MSNLSSQLLIGVNQVGARGSKVVPVVKNSPAKAGDVRAAGSIPGSGRSPGGGRGNRLQCLAWGIPRTEGPGGLQSVVWQRVGHDGSDLAHTHNMLLLLGMSFSLDKYLFIQPGGPGSQSKVFAPLEFCT